MTPSAASSSCRSSDRELVYGRRAVREALRGPREVLELWATERALKAGGRGSASAAPRVQVEARAGAHRRGRDARPPGRARVVRAVPLRRRVRARRRRSPLLVCLDQVTDPRNLGAVVRSAEGAGATGVVAPGAQLRARDAGGLPRLGRRGRAPPGRGRHEPRALPRGDQGRATSGSAAAAGDAETPIGRPTSRRASRSSSAPRGRGCARSCGGVRRGRLDPAARPGRVAERQRRRGGAALRGAGGSACG